MLCTGVNCGDLTGKKYSEKLGCALSTNQEFFYINMFVNDMVGPQYSHEGKFIHKKISSFLPENIAIDEENDVLVINDSAIVDAYDFSGLGDTELKLFNEVLVKTHESLYPDCEFVLIPGKFPIGIEGSLVINDQVKRKEHALMSSHILCVKDYKKHLEKNKVNRK